MRTFDDPATWTQPGASNAARTGLTGPDRRVVPLGDEWELYDLDSDPAEAHNRAVGHDTWPEVLAHLREVLDHLRDTAVPARNQPWPYAPLLGRTTEVAATG